MTCIIGLEHNGNVYIGGDSGSAAGWDMRVTALRKVFAFESRGDTFLIGYTSSFRMGQLLKYDLELPRRQREDEDDLAYLVSVFIPAVRKCLREGGYTEMKNERETGGQFLLGYRGRLYMVDSDFQVNRHACGFDAVGCGAAYAMGAMTVLRDVHDNPETLVLKALDVAGRYCNGVSDPYYVLRLERAR